MRPSANTRVRARRARQRRTRRWTLLLAVIAVLLMPLVIYYIEWPLNLIAAIPLGVAALWLFLMRNAAG